MNLVDKYQPEWTGMTKIVIAHSGASNFLIPFLQPRWWRRRRWTMKTAFNGGGGGAFNGGGSVPRRRGWGIRIGDDEAVMEIDISGGGWRWRASALDSGDGRRWALAFDGGNGWLL